MPQSVAEPAHPLRFPLRVAAVDIGSNALRFIAVEFGSPREHTILESQRVPVRLGHGAFVTGELEAELIARTVTALRQFRARMDALGIEHHRAIATSAVRESHNGSELIDAIREETGIRVEPITGLEEGRLVWLAIRNRVRLAGERWLLVDLGGGSVEVSLAEAAELVWTESLPLGTVRLLEKFGEQGTETAEAEESAGSLRGRLEEYAEDRLAPLRSVGTVGAILATGGNADALADLSGVQPDGTGVRRLTRGWLGEMIDRLASLTLRERMEQLNLREDRADVILPAAIVYERLARIAGTETVVVPGVGLKEGLLIDLVDDLMDHGAREKARTRELEEGALALGRRYRFEEAHARQVTRLSLQLFDTLEELHGLGETDRRILLVAAMLHDAGKLIAGRRHHKHSRYLIRNAELPGLAAAEIELASLVARYHRGTRPKHSHTAYGKLESAERKRVRKLAALLRVGDALDQDHQQQVRELTVAQEDGQVTLHLLTEREDVREDWSFKRKRKLFERVLDRRLRVVYARPDAFTSP